MVKCLCNESCQDKVNGNNYETNKVYEFTEERAKEVCEADNGKYFKRVLEEAAEKAEETVVEDVEKPVENTTKAKRKTK